MFGLEGMRSAFQVVNDHIDNCPSCDRNMTLPQMCPEGQRLVMTAGSFLQGDEP